MTIAQTTGLAVLVLALGGVGGWFAEKNFAGKNADIRMPGESPVRVVGGSITARSHDGWSTAAGCPSSPCYQSATLVKLNTVTVDETGQSDALAPAYDWMIEVFDRNQSPGSSNGIKLCSQANCSLAGTTSNTKKPAFLTLEGNSTFYDLDAPHDKPGTDPASDVGKRFHDRDACGSIMVSGIAKPVDQDYCERVQSIRVTIGNGTLSPTITTYACDDGACKVHIGDKRK